MQRFSASMLVLLACATACKGSDQAAPARPISSQSEASSAPKQTEVPALAVELGKIQKHPDAFAECHDPSPGKARTFALKAIPGIQLASFGDYPAEPNAWSFSFRGMACARVNELGKEVVEVHHGAGTHADPTWYRVNGGPLDRALVRVVADETAGLCIVMPGTADYWKQSDTKVPS